MTYSTIGINCYLILWDISSSVLWCITGVFTSLDLISLANEKGIWERFSPVTFMGSLLLGICYSCTMTTFSILLQKDDILCLWKLPYCISKYDKQFAMKMYSITIILAVNTVSEKAEWVNISALHLWFQTVHSLFSLCTKSM